MSLITNTISVLLWLGQKTGWLVPFSTIAQMHGPSHLHGLLWQVAGGPSITRPALGLTLRVSKDANDPFGLCSTHAVGCNRFMAATCLEFWVYTSPP